VVRPGENLYRISRYYGVPLADLVSVNGIRDPGSLQVGDRLVIPGASRRQPAAALTPDVTGPGAAVLASREPPEALRQLDLHFAWPIQGDLGSRFGWRGRRRHEGIDIRARPGTPVRAAEAGRVIHSGRLGDYGNVVIVKHAGRYSTVYAHNQKNKVAEGQFVEKGDVIATVGTSGNATGPHLHFEVRRDRIAQDPLRYLPTVSLAAQAP
jgi:murein DD-endopeptidase MepM/ murein hydrolase activator NlpD